jgi:hypothetical protein
MTIQSIASLAVIGLVVTRVIFTIEGGALGAPSAVIRGARVTGWLLYSPVKRNSACHGPSDCTTSQ